MTHGDWPLRLVKIVLLVVSAVVVVVAAAVVHWSDSQPHTNHFANFAVLLAVVVWFVVCMEWWARR